MSLNISLGSHLFDDFGGTCKERTTVVLCCVFAVLLVLFVPLACVYIFFAIYTDINDLEHVDTFTFVFNTLVMGTDYRGAL